MKAGHVLLIIFIVCSALSIVTSSHAGRKLFIQIERADALGKRLDTEHRELQVEQSTLAKPGLIDAAAKRDLRMERVTPAQTIYLNSKDLQIPLSAGGK